VAGANPTELVVHGHFYQPPRENPWTEEVSQEPSAAPFHDWNARVTDESYRPNGWAKVLDGELVVEVVNNYANLSFNVGPTLTSWLATHAPDVFDRMVEGDRVGGGAIAQAYSHAILPLADEADVRTQVRWGLADFRHRFGREAAGMWLPEAAVSDAVLAVLAEEGVGFTILAPGQARRVRPLGPDGEVDERQAWVDVPDASVDGRRPYRWVHPQDPALGVDLVFYDGVLSHQLAFAIGSLPAGVLVEQALAHAPDGGLVCAATDGETFGHHHRFSEQALAWALPHAAPAAGLRTTTVAAHLRDHRPTWQAEVVTSAWSCAHGVGRWSSDCGCTTGGPGGTSGRWRAPLRAALDVVRGAGREVFARRAPHVLVDPVAALDAYVEVLIGATALERFAAAHVVGGAADRAVGVEALTLLEQQRQAQLMYTSCAWFFWDISGLETVQVLRYAARAMDLLAELGEPPPLDAFLDRLAGAVSNVAEEGGGRAIWHRHVEPARVTSADVATDLAGRLAAGEAVVGTTDAQHRVVAAEGARQGDRWRGVVTLEHRRTLRLTEHRVEGAPRRSEPAAST
jgi:alpha-amylase/alpha-mannosidase (GH57 family)